MCLLLHRVPSLFGYLSGNRRQRVQEFAAEFMARVLDERAADSPPWEPRLACILSGRPGKGAT